MLQQSHTGLENLQPTGDAGANKLDARLAAIPTTLTGGNDHDTLLGAKALTAFWEATAMMFSLVARAWDFWMAPDRIQSRNKPMST